MTWEYYPIFDGLTDEEIENLSIEAHYRNEEVRLEKNAWRVAEEIAERIDGAPLKGECIHSQLTPKLKILILSTKNTSRHISSQQLLDTTTCRNKIMTLEANGEVFLFSVCTMCSKK